MLQILYIDGETGHLGGTELFSIEVNFLKHLLKFSSTDKVMYLLLDKCAKPNKTYFGWLHIL